MMTYGDHVQKLLDMFPACSKREAQTRIAKAVKDNITEHPWPHLIKEGVLQTEALYNTGTVAITNGLTAVVLTGGTWSTSWVNRRIKLQGALEIYAITITGTTTGTINAPFTGTTLVTGTYTMYRDIYGLPSDCHFGREMAIYDPLLIRKLDFIDFQLLMAKKIQYSRITGIPRAFSRYGQDMTASPAPQIILGPEAPSQIRSYSVFYYMAAPTMSEGGFPPWPEDFEDLHYLRAAWDYAQDPKHPHFLRDELRQRYYLRRSQMKRMSDGRAEMDRRIQGAYPSYVPLSSFVNVKDPKYGY